ncbi:MAG: NAD-dependent deacylase [Candidatus Edwardsbacteria bacterium]
MNLLIDKLKVCRSLVILTGAGISAESGVPTFRGADGLWKNYRAEDLATPEAFARDPKLVWEWYEWRREIIRQAKPNPGHLAIAQFEEIFPEFLLVTQNVDGLHRLAGSKKIVELHGNIFRNKCSKDGRIYQETPKTDSIPPRCECGAYLRPDVVWFGESLSSEVLNEAFVKTQSCEVFLSIGTSAIVHPAASLPLLAKERGALVGEINLEPTPITPLVDISIRGKSAEILPKILNHLSFNLC